MRLFKSYQVLTVLLFSSLFFFACSGEKGNQPDVVTEEKSSEYQASFAILSTHIQDRSDWINGFNHAIDSIGELSVIERFYNIFDSTHVYILLGVEGNDGVEEVQAYLRNTYPEREIGSIMLNEKRAVEMTEGTGDLYTFVTHRVKEFDNWYGTFMAMEVVKNADSIYILGVFSEVGDSMNVGVLSRAASMGKAAAYARGLEKNNMLKASGVDSEPDAIVLRKWDYAK